MFGIKWHHFVCHLWLTRTEWLKIPSGEDKGRGKKKRKNGLRQSREEKFTNSCLQDGDVLSRFFKEGTLKRKKE